MESEIIAPWMKQLNVRRILGVPVRTLVLVAARTSIHEVVVIIRPPRERGWW